MFAILWWRGETQATQVCLHATKRKNIQRPPQTVQATEKTRKLENNTGNILQRPKMSSIENHDDKIGNSYINSNK